MGCSAVRRARLVCSVDPVRAIPIKDYSAVPKIAEGEVTRIVDDANRYAGGYCLQPDMHLDSLGALGDFLKIGNAE
jgi:hypothetical protein